MSDAARGQAAPKRIGGRAERLVVDRLPLEPVADAEALHYDAVLTEQLTTSDDLPVLGAVAIDEGTEVEIKSAAERLNATRYGRVHVQRSGHERLRELGGVYLVAVREPRHNGDIVHLASATVDVVERHVGRWYDPGEGRSDEYSQFSWRALMGGGW